MQLDHINLSTPAELMESVKDFYCDNLDFKVGPRPEIPIPGYWLYPASGGNANVHLIESDNHQPPSENYLDHVAFRVESIEKMRAHLESRSVPYDELKFPDFGVHQLIVTDPAGTKLEFSARRDAD